MFWGIEKERALDREKPQTHAQPVAVKVDLNMPNSPWGAEGLGTGIRALYSKRDRCDLELEVGDEAFPVHQIMLASVSKAFRTFLQHLRMNGNSIEIADDAMAGFLSIEQENPVAQAAAPSEPSAEQPAATAPPAAAPPAAAPPAAGSEPHADIPAKGSNTAVVLHHRRASSFD